MIPHRVCTFSISLSGKGSVLPSNIFLGLALVGVIMVGELVGTPVLPLSSQEARKHCHIKLLSSPLVTDRDFSRVLPPPQLGQRVRLLSPICKSAESSTTLALWVIVLS